MRFYAAGLVLTAALVAAVVADRWPRPRDQPVEPTPGNAIDSALLQRIFLVSILMIISCILYWVHLVRSTIQPGMHA